MKEYDMRFATGFSFAAQLPALAAPVPKGLNTRGKSDLKGRAAELKLGDGVEMYSFTRIESDK